MLILYANGVEKRQISETGKDFRVGGEASGDLILGQRIWCTEKHFLRRSGECCARTLGGLRRGGAVGIVPSFGISKQQKNCVRARRVCLEVNANPAIPRGKCHACVIER